MNPADVPFADLYRKVIMEHYREPAHRGKLDEPSVVAEGHNPLCGDDVRLELKIETGRVVQAAFTGDGCAISMASTSMLTDLLEGRTIEESLELIERFTRFIKGDRDGIDEHELGDLAALEGVSRFPVRIKCALLPFVSVKNVIAVNRTNGVAPSS